jgi:hypothetical protein
MWLIVVLLNFLRGCGCGILADLMGMPTDDRKSASADGSCLDF